MNPVALDMAQRAGLDEQLDRNRMLFNTRTPIERFKAMPPSRGAE
ncbi:hypothetical protein [Rhodoblastus sp.]